MKSAITKTPTMRGNTGAGVNSCIHGREKEKEKRKSRERDLFHYHEPKPRFRKRGTPKEA